MLHEVVVVAVAVAATILIISLPYTVLKKIARALHGWTAHASILTRGLLHCDWNFNTQTFPSRKVVEAHWFFYQHPAYMNEDVRQFYAIVPNEKFWVRLLRVYRYPLLELLH